MKSIGSYAGWLRLAVFYVVEVVKSNLQIAWDVMTPGDNTRQGFLRLHLPEGMSDFRILLVSNLITMTPGTLIVGLSEDRRTLLCHVLYIGDDIEATRHHLQSNYVHRVHQLG
jgi:multicomponent Na+:H+ antiporter subunit E